MPLDYWLAFVAASAIMLAIPGPTVLLVVSYALGYGRRPALAVVAGVGLGGFTAMTASMLGLGAILAASSTVFTALRWVGGAYLVYLGIQLWRAPVRPGVPNGDARPASLSRMFAHAYAVTALNPKGVIFFVVFVPQFLVADEPFPLFEGNALIVESLVRQALLLAVPVQPLCQYGWDGPCPQAAERGLPAVAPAPAREEFGALQNLLRADDGERRN